MNSRTITNTPRPCDECGSTRADRRVGSDGQVHCLWSDACRQRQAKRARRSALDAADKLDTLTPDDTAELAAAMRDAGHAQRERWSEAIRGGRVLRFFATDPKYAALPLADRVKYASDVARASWSLLYLR